MKHNEEIQSSHFGQGCTVSIEGYTCHYRDPDDGSKLILDVHSYLSDNKTQNAATVQNHMPKLMEFLIESKKLLKYTTRRMVKGMDIHWNTPKTYH